MAPRPPPRRLFPGAFKAHGQPRHPRLLGGLLSQDPRPTLLQPLRGRLNRLSLTPQPLPPDRTEQCTGSHAPITIQPPALGPASGPHLRGAPEPSPEYEFDQSPPHDWEI